jgi:hypothetical protein
MIFLDCEDTANELSCKMSSTWHFEDKAGDHFMLFVGDEFLEELEQNCESLLMIKKIYMDDCSFYEKLPIVALK